MTPEELEAISQRAGELEGWDFSRVRVLEEGATWDYEAVVRQYLLPVSVVLDLGTGGGELFLRFAPHFGYGYGIDQSAPRLAKARENGAETKAANAAFLAMDVGALAFPDSSLDIVLASFAAYDVAEVARVLRPGGIFVTQQMGDNDTANIFETFGWGSYGSYWRARYAADGARYTATSETAAEFAGLGCSVARYDEYDARQYYQDLESLVFFLKASPLPQPFAADVYAGPLTALHERYATERGIETNAHRELLIVQR